MGNFLKGILIGIGLSWLIAPMRGEDMRRVLSQRIQQIRGSLPESTQAQISSQVTQLANTVQNVASQAASQAPAQVKDIVSKVSDAAQQAGSQAKQTAQKVADTTQQAATQTQQNTQSKASAPTTAANTTTTTSASSSNNALGSIPGMEPEPEQRLEAEGIYTPMQLLARTATKEERAELAQKIGMTTNMLRTLVDRADLMRLPGMSSDVATLLEENGVNGCKDLQRRNPEHLHATLLKAQETSKTATRTPELAQLADWIAEATAVVSTSQGV